MSAHPRVYSESELYQILTASPPAEPFPTAEDRQAWAQAAARPAAKAIPQAAAAVAGQPIPALPASLFRDFARTGRRPPYQEPYRQRRTRLALLALAECLADDGRHLDEVVDLVWAVCEESTWVAPAHARHGPFADDGLVDLPRDAIDLYAAGTALLLAEVDHFLGDRLPGVVRRRIAGECRRRITDIYLARPDFRWLGDLHGANNWNAVCNAGAVAVAVYLERDVAVQARVLGKALASLPAYLRGFDDDGCTSEGVNYWAYGFSHYAILAHLVGVRTGGRVDLLDGERFTAICRFPVRMQLSPGRFVNFSDAEEAASLPAGVCAWLARRCGTPELDALARAGQSPPDVDALTTLARPQYLIRDLFWADGEPTAPAPPEQTAFFAQTQWLVSRHRPEDPAGLVLAAKGGHNGEHHNQNDVGQFIVHVAGESLVPDLGRPQYTRHFFGPRRYEHLEARSGGHSVPLVNGREQVPGREHGAELTDAQLTADGDTIELELRGAYPPEAGLASLRRRVALDRRVPEGGVTVDDRYRLTAGGEFESRVHTLAAVERVEPGLLLLRGRAGALELGYDADAVELRVEELRAGENSRWGPVLRRLRFLRHGTEGRVLLRLTPA